MIELGKKYRDKVTGFKGTATGHCDYISGCSQTLLAAMVAKDGKAAENIWFDDQRLVEIGGKKIVLDNSQTPGFDSPAPIR